MAKRDGESKKKQQIPVPEPNRLNRRLYARFPVNLQARIIPPSGKELAGDILDISLGGALIQVASALNDEIKLSFVLDGVPCVFEARIVRCADASEADDRIRYGVEFRPNPKMEKTLKSLLPPKS